jgi:hypothetical protein
MGLILSLFLRIPFWVYLAAGLVVWGAYGNWKADRYEKARAETVLESERIARRVEGLKAEAARKIDVSYRERIKKLSRSNAALSADVNGLQQLIQTAPSASVDHDAIAVCGVNGERGRTLERLLTESTGLVQEGAGRVAELTAKTSELQKFISNVCVSQQNAD